MNDSTLKLILQAIDRASGPLSDVSKGLDGIDKKTGFVGGAFKSLQTVAIGALLAITAAAGTLAIGIGTLGISTAAQLETAEVGFTTLLKSSEKASKIMDRIKVEAARTPFEIPGLTDSTQLLTSITKDGDKALNVILDVGEGLAAMGKGQAELDRIIINLQQIGAVGHASMVDIKQFAYNGIPIFELLQKETGLAGEALDKFIGDGKVTFDLLIGMFDKANDAGGPFFNAYINQAGTFNQLLSNSKDAIGILSSDIVKQTGVFDLAKQALARFTSGINENKGAIINLVKNGATLLQSGFNQLRPVFKFLSDNPVIIQSALIGLAGAIAVGVIPVLWGMATAVIAATWPFLLLGGVIGLLYYAYQTNFKGIKDVVDKSISWIVENIWPRLVDGFNYMKDVVLPLVMQKIDEFSKYWDSTLAPAISNFVNNGWNKLMTVVNYFTENVLPPLVDFWNSQVIPAFQNIWNLIQTQLWPAWMRMAQAVWDFWAVVGPILVPVLMAIGAILAGVVYFAILGVIQVLTWGVNMWTWFYNTATWVINGIIYWVNFFKAVFEGVMAFINADANTKAYMIGQFFGMAASWIINKFNEAKDWVINKFNEIKASAEQLPGQFSNWFNQIKNDITSKIGEAKDNVVNKFNELKNINLTDVGAQIIQGLINGVKGKAEELKNTVSSLANSIKEGFQSALQIKSPSRWAMWAMDMVGAGFINQAEKITPQIQMASTDMADATMSPFKSQTQGQTSITNNNNNSKPVVNLTFAPQGNYNIPELFAMFEQWLAEKNLLTSLTGT